MATRDKADKAVSYSSREAGLRQNMPSSLRNADHVRDSFDRARDPLVSAQINDLKKTEDRRRGDGDGSKMVKLDRPFPAPRPKHDLSQVRATFNQNWLSEYRRMQMKQFEAQEQHLAADKAHSRKDNFPKHERGR